MVVENMTGNAPLQASAISNFVDDGPRPMLVEAAAVIRLARVGAAVAVAIVFVCIVSIGRVVLLR